MLTGFMFNQMNSRELVIVSDGINQDTKEAIRKIRSIYSPHMVVLLKDVSKASNLEKIAPWTKAHTLMDGKQTYYLCENFSCKRPTTNIKTILNYLNG